tara:strand:+ start:572 stop:1159 length:588 start_codon:yes stop_codon:yes gene_type:complete
MKKVLFTFFSIFLTYQSIELVKFIYNSNTAEFNWVVKLLLSFFLNLFVTGIFAFLGFVFKTNKIMPDAYYKIKNPKVLTKLYNTLGVKHFKVILLVAFWGKEKNKKRYFSGTKSGVENFDTQTRQSEFGHFAAFIAIFLISFILIIKEDFALFILINTINTIANFYPIILQRIHRMKIERVIKIMKPQNSTIQEI